MNALKTKTHSCRVDSYRSSLAGSTRLTIHSCFFKVVFATSKSFRHKKSRILSAIWYAATARRPYHDTYRIDFLGWIDITLIFSFGTQKARLQINPSFLPPQSWLTPGHRQLRLSASGGNAKGCLTKMNTAACSLGCDERRVTSSSTNLHHTYLSAFGVYNKKIHGYCPILCVFVCVTMFKYN